MRQVLGLFVWYGLAAKRFDLGTLKSLNDDFTVSLQKITTVHNFRCRKENVSCQLTVLSQCRGDFVSALELTARLNTWWFMDSQLLFVHNLSCLSCRLGILTYSRRRSFKWVWKYGSNSGWSLLISRALTSNSTVSKAEDSPVVPNSFEIIYTLWSSLQPFFFFFQVVGNVVFYVFGTQQII